MSPNGSYSVSTYKNSTTGNLAIACTESVGPAATQEVDVLSLGVDSLGVDSLGVDAGTVGRVMLGLVVLLLVLSLVLSLVLVINFLHWPG